MKAFQLWGWLFRKRELVPFAAAARPDFLLLSPEKVDGDVLYEDGWVRVTPAFVEVGGAKKIVVSKIRELRKGLVWQDGLCGLIYRILLWLFVGGMILFGLCQRWLYFAFCVGAWGLTYVGARLKPYYLSIHGTGAVGKYLEFSSSRARDNCEQAIEEAVRIQR